MKTNAHQRALALIEDIAATTVSTQEMENGGYGEIYIGDDDVGQSAFIRHHWEKGEWSDNVSVLRVVIANKEVAAIGEETQCLIEMRGFVDQLVRVMRAYSRKQEVEHE